MCGIAGVLGLNSKQDGHSTVVAMCDAITHRGPDDSGYWSTEGIAFGMRRLSIIDLEGGHQPIWTDDGVGIVFNGEIYNYRELRNELIEKGYRFETHSDTEVLLKAYHCFGLTFIEKLNGMFGFCIIDLRSQLVHIFRDRIGIKPLYYYPREGKFYFGSELRAILAALPQNPEINIQAVYDYLTFGYIPGPASIWKGVKKLDPGCRLTFSLRDKSFEVVPYWKINVNSSEVDPGIDYSREFEQRFLASVEKRIVASDVPVGVFLSGGLDSSSIAAAAIEVGHKNFHTFTFSNTDDPRSQGELGQARAVADHIGSHHHELPVSMNDYADQFEIIADCLDEPYSALSAIPMKMLSGLARKNCKVVLSGEGADEILAGYGLDSLGEMADKRRRAIRAIPRALFRTIAPFFSESRSETLHSLARHGFQGLIRQESAPAHMAFLFDKKQKEHFWKKRDGMIDSELKIQGWYDGCPSDELLDSYLQVHCGSWLTDNHLWRADKVSMAESLELRVPFLDHELVEWASKMPLAWRVGDKNVGYESKRILREFVRKRLPASVDELPKMAIIRQSDNWFDSNQKLGALADHYLLERGTAFESLFDISAVSDLLSGFRAGNGVSVRHVINLLFLARWMDSHL